MKKLILIALCVLFIGSVSYGQTAAWMDVYYDAWAEWNAIPVRIDMLPFRTVGTHWIMFTYGPQSNGTFDSQGSGITAQRAKAFCDSAHAAGKKAILGTGGWGADYRGVMDNVTTSLNSLMGYYNAAGYDGVDLDWEPVDPAYYTKLSVWIDSLKARKPGIIFTAACFNYDQGIVNIRGKFDQINLMTYDMSGGWTGASWHNSAVYCPTTGNYGSIDKSLNQYINGGVPAGKLGFGCETFGYNWAGCTQPKSTMFGTITNTLPYRDLWAKYGGYGASWDDEAKTGYIAGFNNFVSVDIDTGIIYKGRTYTPFKGVGGVIVYAASAAYDPLESDPWRLLKLYEYAFRNGPRPAPPRTIEVTQIQTKSEALYDDALQSPWTLMPVGVTTNFSNAEQVYRGNYAVRVDYGATSAEFRFLRGSTWGAEVPIASDTLSFWAYSSTSTTIKVVLPDLGVETPCGVMPVWTKYTIPLPRANFTFINFWRQLSGTATVWFDDIRFTARGDSVPVLPAAPTLVSPANAATGQSVNQPTFRWNQVNSASSYQIQLSPLASFAVSTLLADVTLTGATTTSYTYPGTLDPGATYYWRVRARSTAASGPYSAVWTFSTAGAQLAAPALVAPSNNSLNQILPLTLSWRRVSGASGYKVQVATDAGFLTPLVNDSTIVDTATTVSAGLNPSTSYYWRVLAKSGSTSSSYSPVWNFTTEAAAAGAPTLASPRNGAAKQPTTLTLAWMSLTGATAYRVQVSTNAQFSAVVFDDSTITTTSRQVGVLNNKTTYYWRARGKVASLPGPYSGAWNFKTTMARPRSPQITSPLPGKTDQSIPVVISWTRPIDADSFRVQVSTDTLFMVTVFDTITADTSARLTSLREGTTYYHHVQARNEDTCSDFSARAYFTTLSTSDANKDDDVPRDFVLEQNFPNPFNPSTTIVYEVPENVHVSIAVYNSLGQEVAALVDADQLPGRYQVVWNAAGVSSGVYLLRLRAGGYFDTRRMMLLK